MLEQGTFVGFCALCFYIFSQISDEEKERFLSGLIKVSPEMGESNVEKTSFYRVPFEEVLNLVSSRRVFLYQVSFLCFVFTSGCFF